LSKWEEVYHTVSTVVPDESPVLPTRAIVTPTSPHEVEDILPSPKRPKCDGNDHDDLIEKHRMGRSRISFG
jgi:hypothetical protein